MPAPSFPQINNGDSGLTVRTTLNQVLDTFGVDSLSSGSYSHAEGEATQAIGNYSHAEGINTIASGSYSHAEGEGTQAIGYASHTEGASTKTGIQNAYYAESVSSGIITLSGSYGDISNQFNADDRLYLYDTPFDQIYFKAIFLISQSYYSNPNTIVELYNTSVTATTAYVGSINYGIANWFGEQTIPGDYSHAEGNSTQAIGNYSHAEGDTTQAIGDYSHAEGNSTQAIGGGSHAEGYSTIASGSYQHVSGQFNTHGDDTSLFIIGNGANDNNRSDIVRVTTTDVQVTGSLNVTGSQVILTTDLFQVISPVTAQDLIYADAFSGVTIKDDANNAGLDITSGLRKLYDLSGLDSVDFTNRQLYKSDGITVAFDWENGSMTGSLIVTGSNADINIDTFNVNVNGIPLISAGAGGAGMGDTAGNPSIEAEGRALYDTNGTPVVNWNNHQLIKSDGTTIAFDWENGSMTGSLDITGSATISNVLTLTPQDPLPSGVPTGSFAVSSSVPPVPYFWDGSVWNALY